MVFDYEVQIPFESPLVEGETLELVLDRGTEVDAPSSSVTVPADITITAFPASASRASDLTFSWSPVASDEIRWDILGNCLQSIGAIDHDVGSATVTPSEIQVFDSTVTCDANLIVTRDRAGTFDPAFASGYMTFEREDHVVYSSTP